MKRNPYGWHYPPGAEFDPRAPYNEKPQTCRRCREEYYDCQCDIFDPLDEDE